MAEMTTLLTVNLLRMTTELFVLVFQSRVVDTNRTKCHAIEMKHVKLTSSFFPGIRETPWGED
jgi:hypothetical protein